ncbi:MAG: response regulator [Planctomycetaceae bacterium]|nr:response regulator [Planctomycetaceae bacterium]MCA9098660.1 response regulator [Planctomycetaceae bacterium]
MERSNRRILLVDDDSTLRECVSQILTEAGYEVLEARDGKEGMMRAERDRPNLIILDLVMPRWSGMTVLEHLRRGRNSRVRVIMMSGQDQERFRPLAESKGVDGYLAKPVCLETLLARVRSILPLSPELVAVH